MMDRKEYTHIYTVLNKIMIGTRGDAHGLDALSASGKITFARKLQRDIDAFCTETLAREKARLSSIRDEEKALAEEFGEEWEKAEPSWGAE